MACSADVWASLLRTTLSCPRLRSEGRPPVLLKYGVFSFVAAEMAEKKAKNCLTLVQWRGEAAEARMTWGRDKKAIHVVWRGAHRLRSGE